jgi:hypothetical protein
MKKLFPTMMAAGVSLCLFLTLAHPPCKRATLPFANADSDPPPRVSYFTFYINKCQWLADARTILAALRYLCESRATNTIIPTNNVCFPHDAGVCPCPQNRE